MKLSLPSKSISQHIRLPRHSRFVRSNNHRNGIGFWGNLGFEMVLDPDGIVDYWWDVPVFGTLQTNNGTLHATTRLFVPNRYHRPNFTNNTAISEGLTPEILLA